MGYRTAFTLALVSLTFLIGCGEPTRVAAPTAPDEPSLMSKDGAWQGFIPYEWRTVRLQLTLTGIGTDDPAGTMDVPDLGVLNAPVNVSTEKDRVIVATPFGATLDGSFTGEQLDGEYNGPDGSSNPITLTRDNPAFAAFDAPRLDAGGAVTLEYQYAEPADLGDGWPTGNLTDHGIAAAPIEALVTAVLAGEQGRLETMVIAKSGDLVLDEYFYGFTPDRPHSIQSITKSVTSLLVGIARDQGKIESLDQRVAGFFPEYAGKRWIDADYPINLRHALTMSAAIDWNERVPYSNPENSNTAMNATGDWIGYVLDRERAGEPGQSASYTSGLSILLGGLIKNATGQYVDEFADDTLFRQLGVAGYHWLGAADGTRHTGGGLHITARDLAKMGQLVLNRGTWNGEGVVSAEWIDESTRRHLPLAGAEDDKTVGYGYQWWHATFTGPNETPVPHIAGYGYGGQYLLIIPMLDTVVVFNAGEYGDSAVFNPNRAMEEYVLPALMGGGFVQTAF